LARHQRPDALGEFVARIGLAGSKPRDQRFERGVGFVEPSQAFESLGADPDRPDARLAGKELQRPCHFSA
jgi:hypothetical protein